jgi:hypothetical protein
VEGGEVEGRGGNYVNGWIIMCIYETVGFPANIFDLSQFCKEFSFCGIPYACLWGAALRRPYCSFHICPIWQV